MSVEMITIPRREYEILKKNDESLRKLIDAGVDGWEGYEDAIYDEEEE